MLPQKTKKIGRPTGSSGEETTARLLETARRHFGQYGYSGARIKSIAADAGTTHSTIYFYYRSKLDLYVATLDHCQELLLPQYFDAFAVSKGFRARLIAFIDVSIAAHKSDPTVTEFLSTVAVDVRRNKDLRDAIQPRDNEMFRLFRRLIEEAKNSGELSSDHSAESFINLFMGSTIGVSSFVYAIDFGTIEESLVSLKSLINSQLFQ